MTQEPRKEEESILPNLVVFDVRLTADPIVIVGGKIVIDARAKEDARLPHGYIDREEYRKFARVNDAIRDIVVNSLYYEEDRDVMGDLVGRALIKVMRDLGYKVDAAKVKGTVPKNWKPEVGIARRWIKKPAQWSVIK